ncbi:30S ribosomal protein S20 [Aliibacillus thermotolerans]|uniref:Small ribosomal subunit protein bS20 n=1 Tax=Aliibacillus thermotolerans TaxID=1834418 RepID=A0ABW0UAP2_9BACI|nr:30S ribosomal protein S20 [Aliibacillus thermotolerans]MDA3130760.1 30S ribosomal protein S20 [Aliibacillus thermotolerans]
MANIKSAKKRAVKSEEVRVKQSAFKSSMRSAVKEFNKKVENGDVEGAKELFILATKQVDKAAGKKMIHKNAAAREKSRMAKKLHRIAK